MQTTKIRRWAATVAGVACATVAAPGAGQQMPMHTMGAELCGEPTLACAVSATPFFAPDGALWLAWAGAGRVTVAKSTDRGRTFSDPVSVNRTKAKLDDGPDERPQLVVDRRGRVIVGYAIFKDAQFNGQVLVASSRDGGATFSSPRSITDDGSSQRFITLSLDPGGDVFATWIDKRHLVAAQKAGKAFAGASLAFAWSSDGGITFEAARIAHDNTCECCRLGVAMADAHRPVVLFRNVFNGERDHAVMTFADRATPGPISRVSLDHWATDVCPHQGPSLSIGPGAAYHAAWFSGGGVRRGIFYARSKDGGKTFTEPLPIGAAARRPTRPYVLAQGSDVWLAWKEFDGERTTVSTMVSRDGGVTWSVPRLMGETKDMSDHPLLVSDGHTVYVSWLTHAEGYHLLPVEAQS